MKVSKTLQKNNSETNQGEEILRGRFISPELRNKKILII